MFLGLEIGGTKLQIVAAHAPGHVARRWRANVQRELGGDGICRQIRQGIAELTNNDPSTGVTSIGVGFGGPIDIASGKVCRSHQIEGWENFPLRDWLAELINAPVSVDNDANVAALGEAIHGAGSGFDPAFYFNMGSGVGGGLVAAGKIYHGCPPGETEFGHMLLNRDGATVESRCSGWAIDARIHSVRQSEPTSILARSIHGTAGAEAKHLTDALSQNCVVARRILDELADDLAFALSHAVHLYHPGVIVMGGGLAFVGEPLRTAVAERLPNYIMKAFHPVPAVKLAGLGEDAVPVGAVELAAKLVETSSPCGRL